MHTPKELKRGDKCPRDGGELRAVPVPSDADYQRAFDRENNHGLPEGVDTASPEQRAELGELFKCERCGYQARFAHEAAAGDAGAAK